MGMAGANLMVQTTKVYKKRGFQSELFGAAPGIRFLGVTAWRDMPHLYCCILAIGAARGVQQPVVLGL
jgi:hypothetical protein